MADWRALKGLKVKRNRFSAILNLFILLVNTKTARLVGFLFEIWQIHRMEGALSNDAKLTQTGY